MGNSSLRESFNAEMYLNPVWKGVDKKKWKHPKGMSYSGQIHEHVSKERASLRGGTGLQNTAIMANRQRSSIDGKNDSSIVWSVVKNEDKPGINPYSMGYKQISEQVVERKRDIQKERKISP